MSAASTIKDRLHVGTPTAKKRTGRKTRRVYSRKQRWIIGLLNLATFFVLWEVIAKTGDIPTLFLPAVSDVFRELREMSQEGILWGNLLISTWIYLVGMVISIAIAVPLGLLIGGVRILDRIFSTYVWALYTTPRLILMPLILLWAVQRWRRKRRMRLASVAP